jgi:hypothetical protein
LARDVSTLQRSSTVTEFTTGIGFADRPVVPAVPHPREPMDRLAAVGFKTGDEPYGPLHRLGALHGQGWAIIGPMALGTQSTLARPSDRWPAWVGALRDSSRPSGCEAAPGAVEGRAAVGGGATCRTNMVGLAARHDGTPTGHGREAEITLFEHARAA